MTAALRTLVLALSAAAAAAADGPTRLAALPGCTRPDAAWADGDSFPVRTPDGRELTVRLYGVDCIEQHVSDDSDARRLRAQRRYFGIADAEPAGAIARARAAAAEAGDFARRALARPFTVHTAYADARGDGRYARVYGFVTTADGKDLAAELVRRGLARAFGVCRQAPDGATSAEYRERLRDLELQAAAARAGAWALTDWSSLPAERAAQRSEDAELEIAQGRAPPDGLELDPNTAARDELMRLPGIGEEMANRVIEHRPYAAAADLLGVPGIGPVTLERLRPFLRFGAAPPVSP
jgi:endonuclease YncB( thermonuclease family)